MESLIGNELYLNHASGEQYFISAVEEFIDEDNYSVNTITLSVDRCTVYDISGSIESYDVAPFMSISISWDGTAYFCLEEGVLIHDRQAAKDFGHILESCYEVAYDNLTSPYEEGFYLGEQDDTI